MAFSPETKWDDVVDGLGGMIGGARFYTNFLYISATNEFYQFAEIKDIDCSDYNESVHTDLAHALTKDLLSWSNGVKATLYLYNYFSDGVNHVQGEIYLTKNGVIHGSALGTLHGVVTGVVLGYCNQAILSTYPIKIAVMTEYIGSSTQSMGGVVEGVTTADRVVLTAFIPFMAGSGLQGWTHLFPNNRYYAQSRDDAQLPYAENVGLYYGGNNLPNSSFIQNVISITDRDTFWNLLNSIDPIDPNDVLHIGKLPGTEPTQDDDPSNPGGGGGDYSGSSGDGSGGYDPTSEPIDFPALPTGSAITTGSIKSFLVDVSHIQAVFRRLWNSSLFDVLTWQKVIEEPMDSIVSLTAVPVTPTVSTGAHIQLGNIDTEVVAPVITNQYITVDCGTLTVPEFWGSALDYSPYTKVSIYLPFIGMREMKPEDVMKLELHVKYNMDILTGNLTAQIKCGQSVLYKFQGNAKASVPLTSRVFNAIEAIMKGAGNAASAYCQGAISAENKKDATAESITKGGQDAAIGSAISSAINVAMSKVNIQRSGDLSGSTGLLDDFVPYLIIHRPIQSLAANFKGFKGYPSNITSVLSGVKGYTEVEFIHLKNIPNATSAEIDEIKALLKAGVII